MKITFKGNKKNYNSQQIFENPTVNGSELRQSCAKITFCSSELILSLLYAGSSIQHASEQSASRIHTSFVIFTLHPTPQTKI
jgi:hypothetical protein